MITTPINNPAAEQLGPGRFIVQFTADGAFAVGRTWTAMTMISGLNRERIYVTGPAWLMQYGATTVSVLTVELGEAGPGPGPATSGQGGGGGPLLGE